VTEEVTGETTTGPGVGDRVEVEAPFYHEGAPQAFQRLWTPHRMVYIGGQNKPSDDTPAQCPFCTGPQRGDEEALIVHRGETSYVIMNLYPAERQEIGELTATAMSVVRSVSHPHGFNLGMNQGEVAGAGIAAHLHQHIVPRWKGDANFMPIIGRTKPVPQLLGQQRDMLAAAWPSGTGQNGD